MKDLALEWFVGFAKREISLSVPLQQVSRIVVVLPDLLSPEGKSRNIA